MMDVPGSFGQSSRGGSRHIHGKGCSHPLIRNNLEGSQSNDACAASHLLHSVADSFNARFESKGTLETPLLQAKVTLLQSLLHPDIASGETLGLVSATARLLGTTDSVIKGGCDRRGKRSFEDMNKSLLEGGDVKRARRHDAFNFLIVYDYFMHTEVAGERLPDMCSLVEPDKSQQRQWKRYKWDLMGNPMELSCKPHLRKGTKMELAQDFMNSETYRMYMRRNPSHHISLGQIMQCICPCISPDKIKECACPICTDFAEALRGLDGAIGCHSCRSSPFKQALASPFVFSSAVSCDEETIDGMQRRDSSEDFKIRPFRCVIKEPVDRVSPCTHCGFEKLQRPNCSCFGEHNLEKEVTWLKRQETLEGKNHDQVNMRLRKYKGTVSELLRWVESEYKGYMEHMYRARYNRRQFHLDCDYFDEETEAVLLMDFSSAMVLGAGYKSVCESDATCNLYVALVLYKKEGVHICDYVRFWSPAPTSAAFHHKALHAVRDLLRDKVPRLKRLRVWTDGHPSTYKGFPNFGRMAYWPLSCKESASQASSDGFEDSEGIEIFHCFFEAYHASGVQDTAGKDPRIGMRRDAGFKKESIYNYHECQVWCLQNMAVPPERKREGYFSASGEYIWIAFSDGEDEFKEMYANLDLRRKEYTPVQGSNSFYEFQARTPMEGWETTPSIFTRRLPCRCEACRAGHMCVALTSSGLFKQHKVKHKRTYTSEDTTEKKAADKERRKTENTRKAQVIARRTMHHLDLENPRAAANPVAAAAAVVIAHALNLPPQHLNSHGESSLAADNSLSQGGPSDGAIRAIAAAYGATDSAQVSRENNCDEFEETFEEEEEVIEDEEFVDEEAESEAQKEIILTQVV